MLSKVALESAHPGPKDLKETADWPSTNVPQLMTRIKCELVEAPDSLRVIVKLSREAFHYLVDDPAYEFVRNISPAAAELKTQLKNGARI